MKNTLLILCVSSLIFTACSKPQTNTHESNTAPDQPMTQTTTTAPPSSTMVITTGGDTAETALDWAGEYKGVFPCADCEGIETELELKADKTYELTQEYLGKGKANEFKVKGTFRFDAEHPSIITLDSAGENRKFFVGENFVEARDIHSGQPIDSKLNYQLIKQKH